MRELRVQHEGVTLAASYSPAGSTAIVALHGAGGRTRDDSLLYRHLHEVLPPVGIGVVTFDRLGKVSRRATYLGGASASRRRARWEAVLDAVDVGRARLWGLSQGAWIGPLAAVASQRVAFLFLIASTGVTPSEQMMYATAEQLRLAGYGEGPQSAHWRSDVRSKSGVHGRGREREVELKAELLAGVNEPWWPLTFLSPTLLDDEGCRRWIEEMDFDPRPVFARVRVPTLLFYGEADSWSPVTASIEAWRAARGDEADIVLISEAEHDLALPGGTLAPEYERTLVEWLVSRGFAG
jgi:pimeloyl-ACP methyl ester carboxylesterase